VLDQNLPPHENDEDGDKSAIKGFIGKFNDEYKVEV
jgi:hypothetical protein